MGNILLSIIIPIFNGRSFLAETLKNILKIRCSKEILLIDDGSVDGSYEYCKAHWGECPDVRILTKKHGGIVDTRNYGLKQACGKWLLFADQDDVVLSETVDEAIFWAELDQLDAVIWSTERLLEDGTTKPCDTVLENQILTGASIQSDLVCDMLTNTDNRYVTYLGHLWGGIYNSALVKNDIFFQRFVDAEDDYLFVMDTLCRANRVGLTQRTGYQWRYNRKSETYRQKYIENIVGKYRQLYQHIDKTVGKCEFAEHVRKKYQLYRIQNVLLRSIENSFQCLHFSAKEQREIHRLYCDHRSFFHGNSVAKLGGRQKRIYWFLQHNMFVLAGLYVYMDSLYRLGLGKVQSAGKGIKT